MEERYIVFHEEGLNFNGFKSSGEFLLFLLEKVYGWDGTNPTFKRIVEEVDLSGVSRDEKLDESTVETIRSLMAERKKESVW